MIPEIALIILCSIAASLFVSLVHAIRTARKLRSALEGLICWAGETPDGPSWATPDAKKRNREMFEKALDEACDCFPENYNNSRPNFLVEKFPSR